MLWLLGGCARDTGDPTHRRSAAFVISMGHRKVVPDCAWPVQDVAVEDPREERQLGSEHDLTPCPLQENDKLHLKTLRIKRNIQRMRLERACVPF